MSDEIEAVDAEENSSYNHAEPEQVAARKAASGRKRKNRLDALRALMSHQQGRDLIWSYLEMCGINTVPFDTNTHMEAFKLGQFNIGMRIRADVERVSPEDYLRMNKEHLNG